MFKRINKQLPQLTVLELQYVAPALVRAQGLELAVPGTYLAGEPVVTIAAFAPQLHVITSKQRPRKLTIHGSDGAEYMFLLKGHEDLRQDERVMQLFGLVNTMLAHDRATAERDLSIARYAVIPLSPNSGGGFVFDDFVRAWDAQKLNHPTTQCRPDRLGAQHGHAARADPRVPRGAQDPAQRGAPPDAGHGARLRPPHRHPEGGGL